MTTTLRAFLDERETAIKGQLKALRLELAEIKVARVALEGASGEVIHSAAQSGPTIKDMIRRVLEGAANGMTSNEVLANIKAEFGKDVERTSLSPQLSRMKGDGEVFLDDDKWYLHAHWVAYTERLAAAWEPDPDLERDAAMEREAFDGDASELDEEFTKLLASEDDEDDLL